MEPEDKKIDNYKAQITANQNSIVKLKGRVKTLTADVKTLQSQNKDLQSQNKDLQSQNTALRRRVDVLEQGVDDLRSERKRERDLVKLGQAAFTFEKRVLVRVFGSLSAARAHNVRSLMDLCNTAHMLNDIESEHNWERIWKTELKAAFNTPDNLCKVLRHMKNLRRNVAHLYTYERAKVTKEEELVIIENMFAQYDDEDLVSMLTCADDETVDPAEVDIDIPYYQKAMTKIVNLAEKWMGPKDTFLML